MTTQTTLNLYLAPCIAGGFVIPAKAGIQIFSPQFYWGFYSNSVNPC